MSAAHIARRVFAHVTEFVTGAFIGGAVVFLIFLASIREDGRGITHDIDPRGIVTLVTGKRTDMDACTFSPDAAQWLRRDGQLCRGTGEDPVNMPNGTITDVPDMWADLPASPFFVAEDHEWFDCRVDGDQFCGYGNSNGVPAGYYGIDHGIFNRR